MDERCCALEIVGVSSPFWRDRHVFLTGHTGFKGAWLALWLQLLGAKVTGFSLAPPTQANLFDSAGVADGITSITGDIRDFNLLRSTLIESRASIVFHLAAQSIVAEGYRAARDTFATNLTGTINLLDAIRNSPLVQSAVIVTSDKCYAPSAHATPHSEVDALGGNDPYSASKACAEIATAAWRHSFFPCADAPRIASARAGNVIGGGDWSAHRLLPDVARAFIAGQAVCLRMPNAVRPWQHVLDALSGYLQLAEKLGSADGSKYSRAWNFGPADCDHLTVAEIAMRCAEIWGDGARVEMAGDNFQQETLALRLDAEAARKDLLWQPRWSADQALRQALEWYRAWQASPDDTRKLRAFTLSQINAYAST